MAVRADDRSAPLGRGAGGGDGRRQPVLSTPLVLVLPGCERFVVGLGREMFTRVALRRFPNGELHFALGEAVADRRCVIVGSISPPPGNLERVTLVAHALRRAGAAHIAALLPYLAYARQDRAPRTHSLGLAWVGELLLASGIAEVACVDVHSEQAAEVLGLPLTSLSPAALFAGSLPEGWRSQVTFVAPDEGAVDRCCAVARAADVERPVVWARKRRTSGGVEHLGLVGTPGPLAVVVDDILDTGDTLVSCCRAAPRHRCRADRRIATHGLFTGDHWRALLAEGVQRIWIADTVLSRRRPAQARVVPVAPLLAPLLRGSRYRGGCHVRDDHAPVR